MKKTYFKKKEYYRNGLIWFQRGIIGGLIFLLLLSISLNFKFIGRDYQNTKKIIELKAAKQILISSIAEKNIMVEKVSRKVWKLEYFQRILKEMRPERYNIFDTIYDTSRKYKLSPDAMLRLVKIESNFNPMARSKVAYGLTQINYKAWKHVVDYGQILNPEYNIKEGLKIFKFYLDLSGGDYKQALFYYNNGTSGYYKFWGYIQRFLETF